jgi:hypothetical protein
MDTFIICYGLVANDSERWFFFRLYGWNRSTAFSECSVKSAAEGRHAMTMNVEWQELYQAALLELRPDELRRRIDEAEKAIQQRIVELSRNDSSSEEERRAMDDALRGLRVLASTECKPPLSTNSGLAQNKATS